MPELPDIEVFAWNPKHIYGGKKLRTIKIVNGKKLPDTSAALTKTLNGRTLTDVYRSGKEFRFVFSGDVVLGLHLMLTGDQLLIGYRGLGSDENGAFRDAALIRSMDGGETFSPVSFATDSHCTFDENVCPSSADSANHTSLLNKLSGATARPSIQVI